MILSIAFKTPVRQFNGARGVTSMRVQDGHAFEWDDARGGYVVRKVGSPGWKFVPMGNVADVEEQDDAPVKARRR